NYDYSLVLNQDEVAEGTITPDSVRDNHELRIAVGDLLRDEVNRLTVARSRGEGVLYYTAHMNLQLLAQDVDAISHGVSITREYYLVNDAEAPITSAKVGDLVNVRVNFTLPEDIHYFVLEDPIPAGTEIEDTRLLTSSAQASGESFTLGRADEYWNWGWWYIDRTELRDEQVNLYADSLPAGSYTYTYQIRTSMAGEFQTMPTHAYAFYFPDVFGRSDGIVFTIEE
ncbi:MAG TPA: hypothetical protein VJZ27_01370, partial [Aggregatilineales bacterium]|nr:hypothetical protein [Aggregatilineales bacterium]